MKNMRMNYPNMLWQHEGWDILKNSLPKIEIVLIEIATDIIPSNFMGLLERKENLQGPTIKLN